VGLIAGIIAAKVASGTRLVIRPNDKSAVALPAAPKRKPPERIAESSMALYAAAGILPSSRSICITGLPAAVCGGPIGLNVAQRGVAAAD